MGVAQRAGQLRGWQVGSHWLVAVPEPSWVSKCPFSPIPAPHSMDGVWQGVLSPPWGGGYIEMFGTFAHPARIECLLYTGLCSRRWGYIAVEEEKFLLRS